MVAAFYKFFGEIVQIIHLSTLRKTKLQEPEPVAELPDLDTLW